jgi:hypothetical protein
MKNNKQIREPSPHILKSSFIVLFGIGVAYSVFDVFVFSNYEPKFGSLSEFWFRIFIITIVAFVETASLYSAHLFWTSIFKRFSENWVYLSLMILVLLNYGATGMMDSLGASLLFFPIIAPFVASFIAGLLTL